MTNNNASAIFTTRGITFTVCESVQNDGSTVVYIDTDREPNGSDGMGGVRVYVNDYEVPGGVPYVYDYCADDVDPAAAADMVYGRTVADIADAYFADTGTDTGTDTVDTGTDNV